MGQSSLGVIALHAVLDDALDDQLLLNRLSVADLDREDVYLDPRGLVAHRGVGAGPILGPIRFLIIGGSLVCRLSCDRPRFKPNDDLVRWFHLRLCGQVDQFGQVVDAFLLESQCAVELCPRSVGRNIGGIQLSKCALCGLGAGNGVLFERID